MRKQLATDDHIELIKSAGGRVFAYFERSDRMVKAASDTITREMVQAHMPPDSHFGVHLITMGAEEMFGPNRNGDSASLSALGKYHPTFVKYGCVYREHNNRDPRRCGIGMVKLAAFNRRMGRGELIVWVDKDKAPDMYKEARAGRELSWSMSMRLPHDECSCCKKKSRTTADYCGHLRDHMLQWVRGHEKYAYARNEEDLKFFDISGVKRRADRIATYLGYMFPSAAADMAKAASEGDLVIGGADWASFAQPMAPAEFSPWEELTLEKLAAAEQFVRHADPATRQVLASMAPRTLSSEAVEALANPDFRAVGGELAKRAVIINFPTFASIVTGKTQEELSKDAAFCDVLGVKLPGLLGDLFAAGGSPCGEELGAQVAPDECGCSFSPDKDNIDRLMSALDGEAGMSSPSTSDRAMRVTIIKSAAAPSGRPIDPFYGGMADAYGYYLVKAAHQAKDAPGVCEQQMHRVIAGSLML